jgi:putative endonuclease
MFWVYILYSESTGRYYKGQTEDIGARVDRHNKGYEKFTKKGIPWTLIWSTSVSTRAEALKLEKKLKNLSRNKLVQFISKYTEGCAGPDVPQERKSGC